jgi:hypothetical protein
VKKSPESEGNSFVSSNDSKYCPKVENFIFKSRIDIKNNVKISSVIRIKYLNIPFGP